MSEIKITKENIEMYKEYYLIQSGDISYKKNIIRWIPKIIASTLLPFITFIPIVSIINKIIQISLLTTLTTIISSICMIAMMSGLMAHSIKTLKLQNLKHFQSKYPNFDIKLDVKKVEELIEDFNLNVQKEKMLSNVNDSSSLTEEKKIESINIFMSMTKEEKIAFLEKEKEFWSQYKETKEEIKEKKKNFKS